MDINGNWIPRGNYYFLIKKINKRGQVSGILSKPTSGATFYADLTAIDTVSVSVSLQKQLACQNS